MNGELCNQGMCEPPPEPQVAAFTIEYPNGSSRSISFDDSSGTFNCFMSTSSNSLILDFENGSTSKEWIFIDIGSDPIEDCSFGGAEIRSLQFSETGSSGSKTSYGKDANGPALGDSVVCSKEGPNGTRLDGLFDMTGRLYESSSSTVYPDSWVRITDGSFECDLN